MFAAFRVIDRALIIIKTCGMHGYLIFDAYVARVGWLCNF